MRPALLYSAYMQGLLSRVDRLPISERIAVWALYRRLRRSVRRKELLDVAPQLAAYITDLVKAEAVSYFQAALALKLAQSYSVQALARAGALQRTYRSLVDETFRLLRLELRETLGLRPRAEPYGWQLLDKPLDRAWLAIADGSFKHHRSGVGIQIFDDDLTLRVEAGFTIEARDPVEAELKACVHALITLRSLGSCQAQVFVDAQSVVHAFRATLPGKYEEHCSRLTELGRQFNNLRVQRVPRITTRGADQLAAAWSSHYR